MLYGETGWQRCREEHTHALQKAPADQDYRVLTWEGSAPDYWSLTQEGSAPDCFVEELVDKGAERVQKAPSAPDYIALTQEGSAPDY